MKDVHCKKEISGNACGAVLGKTDGRQFFILTEGGNYSPILLRQIPIVCPGCRRVFNWQGEKSKQTTGLSVKA